MNLAVYRRHQDFFDEKAASWRISRNHAAFITQLERQIQFHGDETVLDIGCGTGNLFSFLQEQVPDGKIIGLDFAFGMLQRAVEKVRPQDTAIKAMAEVLPVRSASADVVINFCLYPHLKFKQQALREFHRVLKKSGRYYIIHPDGSQDINALHSEIGAPVCNDVLLPPQTISRLLHRFNFRVDRALDRKGFYFIEAVKG